MLVPLIDKRFIIMKLRIITLLAAAVFLAPLVGAGCGGGSSSPTSPAQIPTSVEYAGGTVEGDISVLTSKTVQFVAKDADGNLADASEIITTLTTGSGSAADVSAKALTTAKSTGEYGSCSLNASDPSYIDCTGPTVLPASDVNPRVVYAFTLDGAALTTSTGTGNYTGRLGVSQDTISGGLYSFSQVLSSSDCNGPRVASNGNGWVFMACINVVEVGNGTIRIFGSNDDGATWPGYGEITGVKNTNIIKALKTTEDVATATAYVAYNGQSDMMYIHTITGNADGSITVSPSKFVSGAVHDIAVDTNGGAHVLSSDAFNTCPYGEPSFVINLQYRKVTSDGGFGAGSTVNDCTTKANPGAEPRLTVAPDGSLAHATWRDIGDGGDPDPDITYVKVAEINTSSSAVNWEKTVAATSSVSSSTVLAAGQYPTTDRNGNMALTWDESASVNGRIQMRTFLSPLDGTTDAFSSYLVSTTEHMVQADPLYMSGTAVQIDYAGGYHMFYRDVNLDDHQLLYTMGEIASSALTMTDAIDISTLGSFPFGSLSTDTDWSGKNYITWQAANQSGGNTSWVAVGKTD